jgi:glycosyltransferase involved in cell wall biosynthesis
VNAAPRLADCGPPIRIAVVHEWLDRFAGSERVLAEILLLFPDADVFTIVDVMTSPERDFLAGHRVRTSFIQRLPFARRRFRLYLGLMPLAIEQFDLSGYDLVISSNHAVAKGVITGPDQTHICYVHSPMRYAWDLQAQYLRESRLDRGVKSLYARWLLHRMRNWDVRSSNGVDVFVANSTYIANRVRKTYRRDAVVVAPPVDIARFAPGGAERRERYLVASRFVPYKRVELIVEAFAKMPGRSLLVVGDGAGEDRIRRLASGAANIDIRPPVPQAELVALMRQARAFVFAAEEDFGISMVEAQACGTPVIAFGRGGARDIVRPLGADRPTGVLFGEQTAPSIMAAVETFERAGERITAENCRDNAERFGIDVFRRRFSDIVRRATGTGSVACQDVPDEARVLEGVS